MNGPVERFHLTLAGLLLLSFVSSPAVAQDVRVDGVAAETLREVRFEPGETMPLGVVMGVRSQDREVVLRVQASVTLEWGEGQKTLWLNKMEQLRVEGADDAYAPIGEFQPFPQLHGAEALILRRGDAAVSEHRLDLMFAVSLDDAPLTLVLGDVRSPLQIVDSRREASYRGVADVRILGTTWFDAVQGHEIGVEQTLTSIVRSPLGPVLEVEYELTPNEHYAPGEDEFRWEPMSLGIWPEGGGYSSCFGAMEAGAADPSNRLRAVRDDQGRWQSVRSRCAFAVPVDTVRFALLFRGDVMAHGEVEEPDGGALLVASAAERSDLVVVEPMDALPPSSDWEGIAEVLPSWVDTEELTDGAQAGLSGLELDGGAFLLRVQYGAVEHSLIHLGADSTVLDTRHEDRRGRAFAADLDSDGRREVLLETIEGNALSIYPTTWSVLRIGDDGRFDEVLSMPRSLSYQDGQGERTCMLNRFDFSADGRVEIRNVVFDSECVDDVVVGDAPWPAGTPGWPSAAMERWLLEL